MVQQSRGKPKASLVTPAIPAPEKPVESVPCVNLGPAPDYTVGMHATTPTVIVGAWQLAPDHRNEDREEEDLFNGLAFMMRRGCFAFDAGDVYTGVEDMIGRFIISRQHREIDTNSMQLKVHTKLVPDLDRLDTVDASYIEAILRRSIRRLHLSPGNVLDLAQLHWWDLSIGNYVEAARHLASFTEGQNVLGHDVLVRNIGLSNFGLNEVNAILNAGVKFVSVQVQLSMLDRRPISSGYLNACAKQSVSVLCYGVLAGGLLSDLYLNQPEPDWLHRLEDAPTLSLKKYGEVLLQCGGWDVLQQLLQLLRGIASAREAAFGEPVSIAQVAISWALVQRGVSSVIVGLPHGAGDMSSPGQERAQQITDAAMLELTNDELSTIDMTLLKMQRPAGEPYGVERSNDDPHVRINKCGLARLGEETHAKELLAAWADAALRATGGSCFASRLAWEARYCLDSGKLGEAVTEQIKNLLVKLDRAVIEKAQMQFFLQQGNRVGSKPRTPTSSVTGALLSPTLRARLPAARKGSNISLSAKKP